MRFLVVIVLLCIASPANAQSSCPQNQAPPISGGGSVFGAIVSQWKQFFAAKIDAVNGCSTNQNLINPTINGTPINLTSYLPLAGGTMNGNIAMGNHDITGVGTVDASTLKQGGATLASLYSPLAGSSSLTTVGTIGAGTWNGSPIDTAHGGTNATSQTTHGVAYFDGTKLATGTGLAWDGSTLQISSNSVYAVSGPTTNGNCVEFGAGNILADTGSPCGSGGGGGGSVTSVGLNLPSSIFALSGTPITTSGILTGTLQTQSANTVFAGPTSGSAAAPGFRSLVTADLPSNTVSGPGSSTSGYIPTWSGTAGTTLAAGIAVPVPQASGGTGASSLSSAFDSTYCSTVGYLLVRLTGTWTCAKGSPANPVWWGADPTGTNDSASAISNALAASSFVSLPPGSYKVGSAISYTMSGSNQSVMLTGSGQGNTRLLFPTNSGIDLKEHDATDSIHVRDLTIAAGAVGTGIGLKIETALTSNSDPATTEQSDITNVSFESISGVTSLTDYWGTDILVEGVSNIVFAGSLFSGGTYAHGVGVDLETTSAALIPVVFNFTNDTFVNIQIGIIYGAYVQGVTVSQCNFTGFTKGIYLGAVALPTQLSVLNSQFGPETVTTGARDIEVDAPVNFTAMGNLLYVDGGGDGIYFGANPDPGIVTGNTFISSSFSPSTNAGIFIASAANGTVFSGNFFEYLQNGILLSTGSSGVLAANNTFTGNTTDIGDIGSGNPKTYTGNGTAYWISGAQSGQNPPAGYVGEYLSNAASGVALSNGGSTSITSIVLTPGDWDVTGTATISPTGTIQSAAGGINTTTTFPSVISSGYAFSQIAAAVDTATEQAIALMPSRINVTTPTSVYCVVGVQITSGVATGGCYLRARRWP